MIRAKIISRFFQYFILSTIVVIVFVPLVILIFGALKTRGEFMTQPYALPIPPRWENITFILEKPSYSFWMMLRNSLAVIGLHELKPLRVIILCYLNIYFAGSNGCPLAPGKYRNTNTRLR